jgi:hypothetical protein
VGLDLVGVTVRARDILERCEGDGQVDGATDDGPQGMGTGPG